MYVFMYGRDLHWCLDSVSPQFILLQASSIWIHYLCETSSAKQPLRVHGFIILHFIGEFLTGGLKHQPVHLIDVTCYHQAGLIIML